MSLEIGVILKRESWHLSKRLGDIANLRWFFILSIIFGVIGGRMAFADQEIAKLAREGIAMSQGFAASESSGDNIAGFSRGVAEAEGGNMSTIDDAELKGRAEQMMVKADVESAVGITRESAKRKTIDGYENQEIFTKADAINDDPIAAYERIVNEGCKEKENEIKDQYQKRKYTEVVTDKEIYEQTCEKPSNNIQCEKTLNVSCQVSEECEAGGLVLDSVQSGIEWAYNYPSLRFGNSHGYGSGFMSSISNFSTTFDCNARTGALCCQAESMTATFNIRDKGEVKSFKLNKLVSGETVMIELNGHVIYHSWGGSKLEVTDRILPLSDVSACIKRLGSNPNDVYSPS
jgi:hypothetical protein